jgi:hypothetical protein
MVIGCAMRNFSYVCVLFLVALRQDTPYWLYIFFVSTMSLLLFTGYTTVAVQMDILVDSTGISRCIGQKVIKHIRWQDVRLIWVFDSYSWQERKKAVGIHILPRDKAHPSSVLGGKIVIGENPMRYGKFSELVEALNHHIAANHIPIESTVGGVTSHPDHLVYVPKKTGWDSIDWYNK